jgi:hypothetical protein
MLKHADEKVGVTRGVPNRLYGDAVEAMKLLSRPSSSAIKASA